VVNTTASPVLTKVINTTTAPVPAKIVNLSTAPVQTRDIDAARASNMVTLAYAATAQVFNRALSTGSTSGGEFVVPAG
jgi:hypothetical protein